jgi:hypothetical protein
LLKRDKGRFGKYLFNRETNLKIGKY